MDRNCRFWGIVVLLLLILNSTQITAEDESDNWYVQGGNTVLLEQYTATWCDVCAKIDPWVSDFADNRGSRLVRIALHDPISDPLGSQISNERLSIHSNSMELAPSFWFDSRNEIKGAVEPVDLDRALLNSEGIRSSDTIISISAIESSDKKSMSFEIQLFNISNSSNSQLSIFLLADIVIDNSLATNGITKHEDVAVGYLNTEIDSNFTIGDSTNYTVFSQKFTNFSMTKHSEKIVVTIDTLFVDGGVDDYSIVVAHEIVSDDERLTLGAVSLSFTDSEISYGINVFVPLSIICFVSVIILFKDRFL